MRASIRGAKFLTVMEGEHKVGPAFARERSMGTGLAFQFPAEFEKGSKDTFGLGGRPLPHAAAGTEMLISSG
jgi:hypothetical protein